MRTFVFFIGGTGARVLRSLTMLMASGVSLKNEGDAIVPVIIDFDSTNADLDRSNVLLGQYNHLHDVCDYEKEKFEGGFFRYPLGMDGAASPFTSLEKMSFDDSNSTFGKFIGYDALSSIRELQPTQKLIDSLYDTSSSDSRDRELNLELKYGFKGNPNIGSVVFDQYFRTTQFQQFQNSFSPGDRIFIVASIFGGTGSSGLPQIVKKIREDASRRLGSGSSVKAIREAMLGACVVLPYFKVRQDDYSAVNSLTFNSKAKAALNYYSDEINKSVNEIYYIGCKDQNGNYSNVEGGEKQKNKAHIVELLSAMSIIEFANHGGGNQTHKFFEYTSASAVPDSNGSLSNMPYFLDLLARPSDDPVYQKYIKKLNEFALFIKYFEDCTRKECERAGIRRDSYYKNLEDFLKPNSDFSEKLHSFADEFERWSSELAENEIFSFEPYDFGAKNLRELIRLDNSNKFKKVNYEGIFTKILNNQSSQYNRTSSTGDKVFLRSAYIAAEEAVQEVK